MKKYVLNCANSDKLLRINELIGSGRDRRLLARWHVDGATQEQIAEEFHLSPRRVQQIIHDTFPALSQDSP